MTIRIEFSTADGEHLTNWYVPPPWLPVHGDLLMLPDVDGQIRPFQVVRRRWIVSPDLTYDKRLVGWIEIDVMPTDMTDSVPDET